jgi:hypothetical protein
MSDLVEAPAAASPIPAAGDLVLVNAALEAADVLSENRVPVSFSTLFDRVDEFMRPRVALVAVRHDRASALQDVAFAVYECQLRDGGKVTAIDLVARARELGLLEPFESPLPYWPSQPRG